MAEHRRDSRPPRPAGPAPDGAALHAAALAHCARFAATEAGLRRVLLRRIERWARAAAAEGSEPGTVAAAVAAAREAATAVARRMAATGVVDDAAFAAARAVRLARGGRSRRAIGAHLAAKGVPGAAARAALADAPADELDAALAWCRRRRAGPFAPAPMDAAVRLKALAALARGGFPRAVADAALDMPAAEAEARLAAFRR